MNTGHRNAARPDPIAVGRRIRALRHESSISQSGLAKILEISPGAVGNWEQGQGCPTLRQGVKLADRFDVSLDYIFRGKIHDLAHGRAVILAGLEGCRHDPTGPNLGRSYS